MANKKKERKLPKGMWYDENGRLCINACMDAANSDPIRAARLKKSEDPVDKEKLAELESTQTYRAGDKRRTE